MTKVRFEITRYSDSTGPEHEAIQLDWHEVTRVLGHEHEGDSDDDDLLVQALLAAGAPEWVRNAAGWVDEYGWGLIGPEITDVDQ